MRGAPAGTVGRGGPAGIDNASDAEIDTISTGLTNTSGTLTADLSTGKAGGQSATGGTAASEALTLNSTSHATKGKVLIGTSGAYDEANGRLGVGTQSPAFELDVQDPTGAAITRTRAVTDGAATYAQHQCTVANSVYAELLALGVNWTPSGAYAARRGILNFGGTGGGAIVASNAAGDLRFYAGGAADGDLALTIADDLSSTFLGRVQTAKGADVASAGAITLGAGGNVFAITGTTQIDHVTTTGWQAGSMIVLLFGTSVTIGHNTGSPPANTAPILLAGAANFDATANDSLTLVYDGTNWRETARTVV